MQFLYWQNNFIYGNHSNALYIAAEIYLLLVEKIREN